MAKILVVDDSKLYRQMTAELLRQQGHDVQTAPDGQAAIAQVQATCPDLVILDSRHLRYCHAEDKRI